MNTNGRELIIWPPAWIVYSFIFFYIIGALSQNSRKKASPFLRWYCVVMACLAIDALFRIMQRAYLLWGAEIGNVYLYFIILTLTVLGICFFIPTLCGEGHKSFILIITSIIFSAHLVFFIKAYFLFQAALQVFASWGCLIIACWGLSQYERKDYSPEMKVHSEMKVCSFVLFIIFGVVGGGWHSDPYRIYEAERSGYSRQSRISYSDKVKYYFRYMISNFQTSHPEILEQSIGKELDITRQLNCESDFFRGLHAFYRTYFTSGAVSVIIKDMRYYRKCDIDKIVLRSEGVNCIGLGVSDTSKRLKRERYKKDRYNSKEYLADMAPDAPAYDGVSNIFFELL
ncbi:MAG: hypothetical protein LBL51_02965 [Synergistaceae bacterium]|nr:hypothetical protein [Synergistaceae bacterium]